MLLQAGYEDPLSKYQQYSLGFKHYLRNSGNSSGGLLPGGGLGPEDTDIVLNAVHMAADPGVKMERHDSGKRENTNEAKITAVKYYPYDHRTQSQNDKHFLFCFKSVPVP